MTRVLVWPADQGASGHYRLIWPAQALAAAGHDVEITTIGPVVHWDREWSGTAPPLNAEVLGCDKPDADVVVLQRPGRRHWAQLIPHLQAHGVRVVVDVDDLFTAIPKANVAHEQYDPALSPYHNWEWISRAAQLADWVTVTTPALARVYGSHGRVSVLPNLVPDHYLDIEVDKVAGSVGWAGNVQTHPHDLEVTSGAVRRAVGAVPGSAFHVVGTGLGVPERLGMDACKALGHWVPFGQYPHEVARLEVGIVPLHPSPFNDAKSALKAIEYAALGVAPVMSPTPDNLRVHDEGVGVIADSQGQWRRALVGLLRDSDRRAEVTDRSRRAVAQRTYSTQAHRWLTAWTTKAASAAA